MEIVSQTNTDSVGQIFYENVTTFVRYIVAWNPSEKFISQFSTQVSEKIILF